MEVDSRNVAENVELPSVEDEPLSEMRERGGSWSAYMNQDLSSRDIGHLKFLRFGESCTYLEPPLKYPMNGSAGWQYILVGEVALGCGSIIPIKT